MVPAPRWSRTPVPWAYTTSPAALIHSVGTQFHDAVGNRVGACPVVQLAAQRGNDQECFVSKTCGFHMATYLRVKSRMNYAANRCS